MPSVPTIDDLKMLIAVLSQFAPDNKPFPSPNHLKLAQDLGLRDRHISKGHWFRLVKKMKTGEFGDFGDLIVEKEPVESPAKKRAAVEVALDPDMNEAGPSPRKKVKNGEKSGKGKGKKQVVKAEDDEEDRRLCV